MLAWRTLLAALGNPLGIGPAAGVLFLGQLAKYSPGSIVWVVAAQASLARRYDVPATRTVTSALLLNVVTLASGSLIAVATLPWTTPELAPGWYVFIAVPLGLVVLTPPVLTALCNLVFRLVRRPPLEEPLPPRAVWTAVAWICGTWLLLGAHVAALAQALGSTSSGLSLLVVSLGAFAGAWSLGTLAFVVPSGIGVREVVLTGALGAVLVGGGPAAVTVALVSRLLMTLADILMAVGAAIVVRLTRTKN